MTDRIADVLKDFKVVGNASSFNERSELFGKIGTVITEEQKFVNSNVVKTIAKVIGSTLIKFKDPASQTLVKDLIIRLLSIKHDEAVEHLNSVFKVLATKELSSVSSNKAAKPAAHALMWTVLVVRHADQKSNVFQTEFRNLILYQAALYEIVLLSSNNRVAEHVEKIFFDLWQEDEMFSQYFKPLIELEASTDILAFLMLLVRFKNTEENKFLEQHKAQLLDQFVKAIITSKVKVNKNLVIQCRMLLNTVDEEDFNSKILPPLQRSMLRNPEIILENVGFIIQLINLNFDNYATQLGKVLMQNLYSKDDMARIDSVEGLKQLSMKCSKVQTISNLLDRIFEILNGAEGKITVAEYRINLLQGAGSLSYNSIPSENWTEILDVAVANFSKSLNNEQAEKVICHALEMFSMWVKHFSGQLPEEIGKIFENGLTLKTTTELVRLSYLQWFLAALNKAQLDNASKYYPFLIKIFEKSLQNTTQITLLSEAVCATCIILKTKMPNENDQLGSFWNTVTDLNKQIFFSERFLQAASIETLCHISLMAERLLTQYFHQLKGPTEILYKTLMHCLVNSSCKVRNYMNDIIEQIIRSSNGVLFVKKILEAFEDSIDSIKVSETIDNNTTEGSINSNAISDAICKLCAFETLANTDAQSLAIQALLICHHPAATTSDANLWEKILLQYLELEPKSVISLNINKISEMLLTNFGISKCYENAVTTIVRICPNIILPLIVSKVRKFFSNPELINVNDDEFFTYLTPEGELYDKSVIPNSEDIYATTGLKRENKAYSYKEQLEELQLRREIEEKRRKEGKAKPPQFTPKQKEAIKNQEEKEKLIRQRLNNLNNELMKHISMLKAACKGNSKQVSFYFYDLLNIILSTLCSPLSASSISELYYFLHTTCFDENNIELGEKISITTIRLSLPHCDLNEKWLSQELEAVTIECLMQLHSLSVSNQIDDVTKSDSDEKIDLLSSPSFSYAFEFLKRAMISKCVTSQEDLLLVAIQIIEAHAQLRGEDDRHPKYMPRYEMLSTLLHIITAHSGRVQAEAVAALLEVAKMSSGAENCAIPSQMDIELFLLALQHQMKVVRDVALRALKLMFNGVHQICENDETMAEKLACRLWIAKFDISTENRDLALELWDLVNLKSPEWEMLFDDTIHPELCIQKAAAAALVPLIGGNDGLTKKILKKLLSTYNEKLTMIPPKLDQFDRIVTPAIDQWELRRGVAIVFAHIAQLFTVEEVNHCMQFMVSQGLGDRSEIVQKEMLAAALTIVDLHGKETIMDLLPVFEDFLDKAPKSQSFDNIRQSVVILMGSLARHLEKDDKRIEPIVRRLLSALSTPSQQVQEAVANCLPHLMPSVKDEAPAIIKKLLQTLVKSDKYGERRGAAYGIAGIVKGLGILSLKQLDIMAKLTTYIQEKKNYKSREGALFAFEVLCTTLGRLFEPYIVHVLPHLLQCFGDSSQYVRQAAEACCQVMMAKLSAHGVKLILPSLLEALDEDSWRTKTASVELLGAMAFCAPKQLSSCLPNIVPKLIEVLGDSHTKVQEAGGEALRVIGSVIKNPEIQAIVPVLLKALEDPSKNTSICLHSLLKTKFVHFIDAPSLALIMPVVSRAFLDRSTETRKMAAQIIGNMYSLTDQKDLTPYLPNIIPGLKMSLLDPVPEVRAVSARALGAMVRGMGETSFDDLLPWLMQTLTSESSVVDRSGAAQGLSEVVGGLGVEKLHKLMPEIIATAERSDIAPHVKDGYIMMFIYMPAAFPQEFTPYIGQIINPILKALADENEYVRDTALKAGQRIVNLYAETAVTLLLPELEKGLFDDNWRIRYSSVQLLGDLLYRISGVSGKMTTETASEDDNFGTEQSHQAIIRFLGEERRNRVLSGLYMGRSDVSLMVRQAALHVWKIVVTNTPRTLREILPTLFSLLLGCLASTSYDKRQVAARTLGDLVRKLGERVLPEIIPILERGLNSEQADQRQGVCIGLSEIMASTSKDMVLLFVNSLVPTVRKALSDPLPEVREAAAKTFESLHSTVGSRALDDILPAMLEGLSDPDPFIAENTLDGLRQVVSIKPRVVLPYLVPQLTTAPVNTKALSILVSVAGDALTKYLPKILSALLQALSEAQGTAEENQELEYSQTVILSVTDETGIRTIMDVLMTSARSEQVTTRKSAASLLSVFCMHSPAEYSQYVPQLLRCLLRLMADSDRDILQRSWDALNAVQKKMQIAHVSDVRQAVRFAASDLKEAELPGFCLPKGITPLLPLFREAILNAAPEEKENAAQGLGEIISLTSAQSLQPSVVHITGPLIRILGDRFNAGVKAAVLETLAILLRKVGVMLKQFLPQLQTTFLKALHDQNRTVRIKAGMALSKLVVIHTRADPLFNEIHSNIKANDDIAVKETMLYALRSIITPAGEKMTDVQKKQIYNTLLSMLGFPDDNIRGAVGGCLAALLKYIGEEQIDEALCKHFLVDDNDESPLKHGRTVVLYVGLKECPQKLLSSNYEDKIIQFVIQLTTSQKIPIACNGVRSLAYMMQYYMLSSLPIPQTVITAYIRSMNHNSNEVKQLVAKSCNYLAKVVSDEQFALETLKYLVPMLVNGTKEKNGYVKSNSEIALLSILRLRDDETTYQRVYQILEAGAKDSLNEVVSKVLRKAVLQPIGKDEELDETLLN